jgi:tetratricopeptide (TPR) repeat protein
VLSVWAALSAGSPRMLAQTGPEQLAEHQHSAQEAEARGDFDTAVREYEVLTKAMPASAELQSNLGVALYFHQDLDLSEAAFHRAVRAKPGLYAPHLFLGLIKSRESQPDAAVVELRKAIHINDADPMAHTWLAYAYIAQSRYPEGVEQLQQAAAQQPQDLDVAYALGQSYLELAKQATATLLKNFPDGGRTWQLAAEQAEAQGNQQKARDFYSEAFKRRPDIDAVRSKAVALDGNLPQSDGSASMAKPDEDTLYAQAHEYEQQARTAFERVSANGPDSYRAHQILADSDVASDHFDEAIFEYQKVLDRKPDLPGIHGALCNAFERTAQIEKAIKECDAEIALAPYNSEAYVHAARMHLLTQDDGKADALLQKASRLNNPPIAMYKFLGEIAFNKKQYRAAIVDLKKYLAIETRDSSGFYLLSRAYRAIGDVQEMKVAIAEYKRTKNVHANANEAQLALDARRDDHTLEEQEQKDPVEH